jgi:transcriptional antiterminator RfaH
VGSGCRGPAWYCARTKPKHEHLAAASVTNRLGVAVYNPRLLVERATVRGVLRFVEPLFPGYLFVQCASADQQDQVRYAYGISSLVHFGPRAAIVPEEVISELKARFPANEPVLAGAHFRPETEVRVTSGPFQGFEGVVLRVLPAKQRAQLLLDFLGRTTLAETDLQALAYQDPSRYAVDCRLTIFALETGGDPPRR